MYEANPPLRTYIKAMKTTIMHLPTPPNLSSLWNFGSLMGAALMVQIISGLLLSLHYIPHETMAFPSWAHVKMNVWGGWLLQSIHSNGASFFFMFIYIHIGRGMYYTSFKMTHVWLSGISLLLILMATAFLGYVLPWGQMSFWGATVITNMLTAVPYLGEWLLGWLWGGFSVGSPTLQRFFILHFCLPFLLAFISLIHIYLLHETGSNNPLGIKTTSNMQPFHPLYTSKDLVGVTLYLIALLMICLFTPTMFMDPLNFTPANPLSTPNHIQPEWYFLWAYAILRSVPNKLGGVCAMVGAILVLATLPYTYLPLTWSYTFAPHSQLLFWIFITNFTLLTWIGGQPVEDPYITLGQVFSLFHFLFFILAPFISTTWVNTYTKLL